MRAVVLYLAFDVVSSVAFAQGTGDPLADLRTCSRLEGTRRLECLEKLSHSIAPAASPTSGRDNWIVSETTSPVDYTPIVAATAASADGSNGTAMHLTVHCRGGRTELVIAGPTVPRGNTEYVILYRINDAQPVQLPAASPSFGAGAAFTGDVVRLLQTIPENGHIVVRVSARGGATQEGRFSLSGLKSVREKLSVACKWPSAIAAPRN